MAVAHTTLTSEIGSWRRDHITRDVKLWFGKRVPEGVIAIEIMHNYMTDGRDVRWRVKGDPTIHEMPFDMTDDCVDTVLIAMKLTC